MYKKITYIFLLFVSLSFSQNQDSKHEKDQIPLKELISQLEKQYDVRFSFDPTLVEKYKCFSFEKEKTLEEKLIFLRKETNLIFDKIDKRYIIIKEKEPTTNQTVCGFLIDEMTREPIVHATVWVENKSIGVTTDEKGFFQLKGLQSNWEVRIDYLGYDSKKAPVFKLLNVGECFTIALSESNEELEEVLISDYLTQGVVKKNGGSVKVSPSKLGILPGLTEPDVLQSLQMLPGVQSPGENASGLHIRGGTPDQNLILFDGIKMYQSGHFFGLISAFNPYITKEIEFYRSGTRAKYGDRIGGVLDISSGNNIPESKFGIGTNMTHADVYAKTPLFNGKVGVIFSARRSLTDVWNSVTFQNLYGSVFQNTNIVDGLPGPPGFSGQTSSFYFQDYNLKVIAEITASDKIIFSNLYNKNLLNYEAESARFNEKEEDNLGIQNTGINLKWEKRWNSKLKQDVSINTSTYTSDYKGRRVVVARDPRFSRDDNFEKLNKVEDRGIDYNIAYKINENSTLNGGYQLSKNAVTYFQRINNVLEERDRLSRIDPIENITNAGFIEHIYKNEKWFLSTGIRYNHFSRVNKSFFEPRFFVSNQILESLQLKLSAEVKNQVLSQVVDIRPGGLEASDELWTLSNLNQIPVLSSNQFSAGFIFTKNGWNLDIDFYKKNIDGLVLVTDDDFNQDIQIPDQRPPQYQSGKNTVSGIDFLLKKRFGNYRSWISYSYSKSEYTYETINDGNSFNGSYEIPHSLVWSHTYLHKGFEFSLGWKIRSGIPYTSAELIDDPNQPPPRPSFPAPPVRKVISYGTENANRLPNYQKLDFSTTYKFNFSKKGNIKGKVGISLLNILDTKNILDRHFERKNISELGPGSTQEERGALVTTDRISIGFTPNIVFRISF